MALPLILAGISLGTGIASELTRKKPYKAYTYDYGTYDPMKSYILGSKQESPVKSFYYKEPKNVMSKILGTVSSLTGIAAGAGLGKGWEFGGAKAAGGGAEKIEDVRTPFNIGTALPDIMEGESADWLAKTLPHTTQFKSLRTPYVSNIFSRVPLTFGQGKNEWLERFYGNYLTSRMPLSMRLPYSTVKSPVTGTETEAAGAEYGQYPTNIEELLRYLYQ